MRRRIGGDNGNENSPTDNSSIAGPTGGADPREPSAARTPIKSSAPAPAVAASNEQTLQGMESLDDDDDEHDSAANGNSDRYDTGNFFARSAAATDGSDGRESDGKPALDHRLDTAVRQQSELRRRKLVVPRKSGGMFSPNDNGSSSTAPSSNGAAGKVRKRGNLRVLVKSTSSASGSDGGGGGGSSSVATSMSTGPASTSATSSAFFTRSVRSVVDTAASVQSTARSAAAPVAGMSKKIVNAGKMGISILSPTFAMQSRAAATPCHRRTSR